MFRKFACALVMLALCVGITLAEEIRGTITKVENGKVTFAKTTFNKETRKMERGESQTLSVADKVKVVKVKFNRDTKKMEVGDPVEGGLKNEVFTKIGRRGVFSTIVTDSDNKKITEIRVFAINFAKRDK